MHAVACFNLLFRKKVIRPSFIEKARVFSNWGCQFYMQAQKGGQDTNRTTKPQIQSFATSTLSKPLY
jgi:hypothetical protein